MDIPWITFDDLENIERAAGKYIKSYDYSMRTGLQTIRSSALNRKADLVLVLAGRPLTVSVTQIPLFTL